MTRGHITDQIDNAHYSGTARSKTGRPVVPFARDVKLLAFDSAVVSLQMLGNEATRARRPHR